MFEIGLFINLCHKLLLKICNYGVFGYYFQQLAIQIFIAFTRCRINKNVMVHGRDRFHLGDFLANDGTLRKISNKDVTERPNVSMIFCFK